jgi:DNA-binding NarL/FixJ family response regulator
MIRRRLVMADDHTLVLEGFRKLLEEDFDLVAVAEDGRELVAAVIEHKPDVILVDISMPLLNGIEAARQVKKAHPSGKIVFVTMHGDPAYVAAALNAGASGYVLKRSAASELAVAIREVLAGRSYLTPLVDKDKVLALLRRPSREREFGRDLSSRQLEVLQLVAEGRATKEIAEILHISVKTVEYHKSGIMQRLGVRTTAELTKYAIEHGMLGPSTPPSN